MQMLGDRVIGCFKSGFVFATRGSSTVLDPLAHLTPGTFLSAPGLWLGLVAGAAFLAAAIRLRRYRDPI